MKGTRGGQDLYPHESQYPVHELSIARVSITKLRGEEKEVFFLDRIGDLH